MSLSDDELERYARHIVLREIDVTNEEQLGWLHKVVQESAEKQADGDNAEPGVEGCERRPIPEPGRGDRAREKAHAGDCDRGLCDAQVGAKQIRRPPLATEASPAQTQTRSQRESHSAETRDHPQGMHVGV